MINQLKSYRNGVHGPFFLSVAAELERLQTENEQLRTDAIETAECVTSLRNVIRQMNVRAIVNTKSVQIFGEIEQIIERVRNMEQMPTSGINTIGTLLDIIKEEANKNGITG